MALSQLNSILCPDIAGYVNQFMNLVMATQQEIEADPNHVMAERVLPAHRDVGRRWSVDLMRSVMWS